MLPGRVVQMRESRPPLYQPFDLNKLPIHLAGPQQLQELIQGNGTAKVFQGDPDIFTFSMHGAKNYPFTKEESHLDIELDDGLGDGDYLARLDRHLESVLDRARPDLAVYVAGADPYGGDRLGRLALSMDGLRLRDRRVFRACRARGVPVVMVLGGGYAADLNDVVTIHANTVRELRASHG